jgi:hypothetical protein
MVEREDNDPGSGLVQPVPATETLPYRIELWDTRRAGVERVVARAAGAQLARAIFQAAQTEYLGRLVTLSRGRREISRSA